MATNNHSLQLTGHACLVFSFVCLTVAIAPSLWAAPVTLVDNGSPDNRVDILFFGDGYRAIDHSLGVYDNHIDSFLDYMFDGIYSDPFPRYENFFNVHKIVSNSNQAGADIPNDNPPQVRDTFFDASYEVPTGETYNGAGNDRLILMDGGLVTLVRNGELAGTNITGDLQLMSVNESKYGGAGGTTAVPVAVFAGDNEFSFEIGLHELAHSFGNLADEYGGFPGPYTGAEPSEANVTADPTGAKWQHWLGFDDPRGPNLDIGVFSGARYYTTGLYRPSPNSKMRSVSNNPPVHFDAVSREQLILSIYDHVDPIDSFLPSPSVVDNDLWVDVVDPDVIKVEWYVDHQLVPGATGETFNPHDFGFGGGDYLVTAFAYDEVIDHAFGGGMLDLVRTNFNQLSQSVEWLFTATHPADFDGNGMVELDDYDLWRNKYGTASPNWWGDKNGIVDMADYVVWRDAWKPARLVGAAEVPEPSTACTFLLTALTLGGLRWRRRA